MGFGLMVMVMMMLLLFTFPVNGGRRSLSSALDGTEWREKKRVVRVQQHKWPAYMYGYCHRGDLEKAVSNYIMCNFLCAALPLAVSTSV